jgi:hypothetical protein
MAQVGTSYCSGVSCPCGNDDPSAGCGNLGFDGVTSTGASLIATGTSTYACLDDVGLVVTGMQSNQFGLVYMGDTAINLPFGDGHRCVSSTSSGIFRFPLRQAGFFGDFAEPNIISTSQGFSPSGRIAGGSTWFFQGWYRDPGGPCGAQFNLTNALEITFLPSANPTPPGDELAGVPITDYPHFEFVRSMNMGTPLYVAADPSRYPQVTGQTTDVYVVAAKTATQWDGDNTLTDVRGSSTSVTFAGGTIQANTALIDVGTLNGINGTDLGVGYDVVIDINQNGVYDGNDILDGYGDIAGIYVMRDLAAPGPYAVTETIYTGGSWLGQDLYYPSNIASLGELPLIVVSHGNGHNYQWYDHLGNHMASYGYIVMSHQNQTGPGIQTASTTTLTNTDYLLGNLGSIAGGALQGHINTHTISWIGHSRGGEGVARAYDRLHDEGYNPSNFTIDDIQFVSSIAPTDFLGPNQTDPHDVDYHLWTGSADADVNGSASCDICQTYHLLTRATGRSAGVSVQGAGHGAFHAGSGSTVSSGPCLLSRAEVHTIMKPLYLSLVRHFVQDDPSARDYIWRQFESFKALGVTTDSCAIVTMEFDEGPASENFVIDDFESGAGSTMSSGAASTFTVSNVTEGVLNDNNSSFAWTASDPMNGMTQNRTGESNESGIVFDWNSSAYYECEIIECEKDFTKNNFLSFRAAQGTRHPNTLASTSDTTFLVTLEDGIGGTSSINIGAYGGGVEQPYARSSGWHNEWETIRIRLTDFATNGAGIDLNNIKYVRFEFGAAGTSAVGRLGLDDIRISRQ